MPKPVKGGFYAVSKGRQPGVFLTWDECEAQTKGFTGAKYKKFMNVADAEAFVAGHPVSNSSSSAIESSRSSKSRISDVQDESGWYVVYSDGACKGNGKVGSVAGVGVWWGHDDPRNLAERCPGDQTNNRAELIAIIRVLETVPWDRPVLIKTDSKYSIQCTKDWLPNWERNGFKTASGDNVKNAGIVRYLSALIKERERNGQEIRLQYVKGHSGDIGNDGADAQANKGAVLSSVPECDWEQLAAKVNKRVSSDRQKKVEKPTTVSMDLGDAKGGSFAKETIASSSKIKRVESPEPQPYRHPDITPDTTTSSPLQTRTLTSPVPKRVQIIRPAHATLSPTRQMSKTASFQAQQGPSVGSVAASVLTGEPPIPPTRTQPSLRRASPQTGDQSGQTVHLERSVQPEHQGEAFTPSPSSSQKRKATSQPSSPQPTEKVYPSTFSSVRPRRPGPLGSPRAPIDSQHGVADAQPLERNSSQVQRNTKARPAPSKAPAPLAKNFAHVAVGPQDIDIDAWKIYADCVLSDDDLMKELED